MKQMIAILTLTLAGFLISGCMKDVGSCNDPDHCTTHCIASTPCGKVVRSRCREACDGCNFNEPSCQTCLECTEEATLR